MRNILNVEEFEKNKFFERNLNLDELGLIYCLLNFEEQDLNIFLKRLNLDIQEFKKIISSLENKNILTLNIDVNKSGCTYWIVKFINSIKKEIVKEKYEDIFILSELQKRTFKEIDNHQELFLKLFKLYEQNKSIYETEGVIEINNEEEYINYLESISPISLLNNLNINVVAKELYVIYEEICIKNKDKSLINFLIDYVISTSVYNNFSLSFFNKIIKNWESNDINDVKTAINYIKEAKEKTNKSIYQEPEWEEVNVDNVDVESIDKMLKEFGNK